MSHEARTKDPNGPEPADADLFPLNLNPFNPHYEGNQSHLESFNGLSERERDLPSAAALQKSVS